MPVFVLEHLEKKKTKRLEVRKDTISVGRRPDADIALIDTGVSKRHLLITRGDDGGFTFEDLGSQNGTFINGVRRQTGTLAHRDVLRIGRIEVTVLFDSDELAAELTADPAPAQDATVVAIEDPSPDATIESPGPTPSAPGGSESGGNETTAPTAPPSAPSPPDSPTSSVAPSPDDASPDDTTPAPEPPRRRRVPLTAIVIVAGVGLGVLIASFGPGRFGSGEQSAATGSPGGPTAAPAGAASAAIASSTSPSRTTSSSATQTPTNGDSPATVALSDAVPGEILEAMGGFPDLVTDPLGAYTDAAESERVLLRLYLDFLGRPPTRGERRNDVGKTHFERWKSLRWRAAYDFVGMMSGDVFRHFLDREPDEAEARFLQGAPYAVFDQLDLWLTATRSYRAAESWRNRSLRQFARSLVVDLRNEIPPPDEKLSAIEDAIIELPRIEEIVRTLAQTAPEHATEVDVDGDIIAAEVWRFLGRDVPPEALETLTENVRASPRGLTWLRQTLALDDAYWRY